MRSLSTALRNESGHMLRRALWHLKPSFAEPQQLRVGQPHETLELPLSVSLE